MTTRRSTRAPPAELVGCGVLSRIPPVWLVVVGILSVQLGAGIAKNLFDDADPTTLVWLRLATSAVILAAIARPALRGRTPDDWRVAVAFGISLGTMNWAIYQSFARIPLGIAVTIEFLGPLTLAVLGSRRPVIWCGRCSPRSGSHCWGSSPGSSPGPGSASRFSRRPRLGGVHPAERLDRTSLAGTRRPRRRQRGGRRHADAVAGVGLRPRARTAARARRGRARSACSAR